MTVASLHITSRNENESKPLDRGVTSQDGQSRGKRFEEICAAHLDAAYNLARWLTRDDSDAEDVVQEACLRGFRFIDGFHGDNGRAWLLAIVRNTFYTWHEKNRPRMLNVPFDEEILAASGHDMDALTVDENCAVDRLLEAEDSRRLINQALDELPAEFREVIVLRELEELSYKEIAAVTDVPIGTVMSRLARGRKLLQQRLRPPTRES